MWNFDQIQEASAFLAERLETIPPVALVLGSGLGNFADELAEFRSISFAEIPHFPVSTVPGHRGRLVLGRSENTPVLVFQGRSHLYEGYSPAQIGFPARVLAALGVKQLVLTNAAGAVNTAFAPGDLMLLTDHINFMAQNPLTGPNDDRIGERFPDLSMAYDPAMNDTLRSAAREENIRLREGVYLACAGPSYETPAEIRMYRIMGADACGMSTVPEVIAANHAGIRTAAITCITNMGAGIQAGKLHHEEVTDVAAMVAERFTRLLKKALPRLAGQA